jgi:HTH-type transcriptional regulator, global nitrogen regulator NrpRI
LFAEHRFVAHADSQRKIATILRVLDEAGQPLGSTKIAQRLRARGIDIEQRMVRNYLDTMDAVGMTVNLGRRGRQITEHGRSELQASLANEKITFLSARMDEMAYGITLDLARLTGTVALNLSTIPAACLGDARRIMSTVMVARLGMGHFGHISQVGEDRGVPGLEITAGRVAIGTVCSITLNGLLRAEGIPVVSRFGGLLQMRDGKPHRFTHVIQYSGTTLDPIEVFIKARMTSVLDASRLGSGRVGASFREVPAVALPHVRRVIQRLDEAGLGGLVLVGDPGRPLLDIPVEVGRAGLVVAAGLNPLAAVEEAGVPTENQAMARLGEFGSLVPLVQR